ncbi:bifunctional nuclease family protein [Parabacteroides sp. Marseille-P3160]|uniref:bifunctional nuclease family protein n=1 Tax=Parabacteroides sp. Marseille-P3160 TaxID=1917887 RepID=UPI0009BA03D2|nr:bifunctional nuclease family protein [Parabacteroides sp. Marseille-P3160]
MDTRIKLRVQGLTNSQIQSGAYALILAEEDGVRRIPVIVGTAEAQSIAIALEGIKPPRPLTHDLFVSFVHAYEVRLLEVFIYRFEEGIFYSELLFTNGEREVRIDSRTSDAIAIALRMKCAIYATEEIMIHCGIVIEVEESSASSDKEEEVAVKELAKEDLNDTEKVMRWLARLSDEELKERLKRSISDEIYEFAKIYRDELSRRGKKEN